MQRSDGGRRRGLWARGLIVLGAVLGLGLITRPAAAAPFAYVTNVGGGIGGVSVIDAATNAVVANINVGCDPVGVAVTPDGKHAYVTDAGFNNVLAIDTATNMVVATIAFPGGASRGGSHYPCWETRLRARQGIAESDMVEGTCRGFPIGAGRRSIGDDR